jgi:hypothetical protein
MHIVSGTQCIYGKKIAPAGQEDGDWGTSKIFFLWVARQKKKILAHFPPIFFLSVSQHQHTFPRIFQ